MWSIVGLALAVLGIVLYLWFTPGRTPAIHGPNSIASLERIRIGHVDQYILIRGNDSSLPVLLFLHGGPGMPAMYLAHAFQDELEKEFVVVQWDRRAAGKSYREVLRFRARPAGATSDGTLALRSAYIHAHTFDGTK